VLVTTNVISRGIDVLQVNMVVNYDLPLMGYREKACGDLRPDNETHFYRIGTYLIP
jgi:ATP-dependent RNA helicase DDX19/DBP5